MYKKKLFCRYKFFKGFYLNYRMARLEFNQPILVTIAFGFGFEREKGIEIWFLFLGLSQDEIPKFICGEMHVLPCGVVYFSLFCNEFFNVSIVDVPTTTNERFYHNNLCSTVLLSCYVLTLSRILRKGSH